MPIKKLIVFFSLYSQAINITINFMGFVKSTLLFQLQNFLRYYFQDSYDSLSFIVVQ